MLRVGGENYNMESEEDLACSGCGSTTDRRSVLAQKEVSAFCCSFGFLPPTGPFMPQAQLPTSGQQINDVPQLSSSEHVARSISEPPPPKALPPTLPSLATFHLLPASSVARWSLKEAKSEAVRSPSPLPWRRTTHLYTTATGGRTTLWLPSHVSTSRPAFCRRGNGPGCAGS